MYTLYNTYKLNIDMGYYANDSENAYEDFSSSIKIHPLVSDNYGDINGDILSSRDDKILNQTMYDLFEASPYYEKYKGGKKIDKYELLDMYYYFRCKLSEIEEYNLYKIFICFAEFFDVNYKILYNEICVMDKDIIIRELSENINLSNKINNNKLF